MAKFKLDSTDGVIIGAAGLVLTFIWYIDQAQTKAKTAQAAHHKAVGANDGRTQAQSS